jgi:hypothetical protein
MHSSHALFSWLDEVKERKIYVVDDFSLDFAGEGDISCRHGKIVDVCYVPNLSANMLFVAHLT